MGTYHIQCECGSIKIDLHGAPRVRGHCHCSDCRELLNIPYHSVTAWNEDQVEFLAGEGSLKFYQHPRLSMQRAFCGKCGETLFNTNAMNWRVVSQHLIRKCRGGILPEELAAQSHFFYSSRIIDVEDELPKKG